jgi:hypothetical protein
MDHPGLPRPVSAQFLRPIFNYVSSSKPRIVGVSCLNQSILGRLGGNLSEEVSSGTIFLLPMGDLSTIVGPNSMTASRNIL